MNEHFTIKELLRNTKLYFYYLYLKWIKPARYNFKKERNKISFTINPYSCRHFCLFCKFKNECDNKSTFDYKA